LLKRHKPDGEIQLYILKVPFEDNISLPVGRLLLSRRTLHLNDGWRANTEKLSPFHETNLVHLVNPVNIMLRRLR